MPKPPRQQSLFTKTLPARLRANIIVTATPRTESDLRLYAKALIALAKQHRQAENQK